jgi:hypothetical protein
MPGGAISFIFCSLDFEKATLPTPCLALALSSLANFLIRSVLLAISISLPFSITAPFLTTCCCALVSLPFLILLL